MRSLLNHERDMLISRCANCLDARPCFDERRKQVELARAYRKPTKPGGIA